MHGAWLVLLLGAGPLDMPGLVAFWDFAEPTGQPRYSRGPEPLALTDGGPEPIERVGEGVFGPHAARFTERGFLRLARADLGRLNLHGPAAQVTVVAWLRRAAAANPGSCQAVAGIWNETRAQRQYCLFLNLRIHNSAEQVCGHVSAVGGPTPGHRWCMDAAIGATPVPLGEWRCVAMTYDGQVARAYLDGRLDARPERNPYPYAGGLFDGGPDGADFTVGGVHRSGEMGNSFRGDLGGLAVYDRALSDDELLALAGGGGRELLVDPRFQQGVTVLDPAPGRRVAVGHLRPVPGGEPAWDLAQWSSRASLAGAAGEPLPSGSTRYADACKSVIIGRPGSAEGDLRLRVNGGAEFPERSRRQGEPWPHLLVSQEFAEPPAIAELRTLRLRLEARLIASRRIDRGDYQRGLHAAQFQMFLTVQNRRRESPGYGDFLWFGVPLYDDRFAVTPGHVAPDQAHHKLIVSLPSDTFVPRSLHDGDWVPVDRDLLPLLRRSLEQAWERGFLSASRDASDYRISGVNLGWEVPGPLDVEAQVRGLSLWAE